MSGVDIGANRRGDPELYVEKRERGVEEEREFGVKLLGETGDRGVAGR